MSPPAAAAGRTSRHRQPLALLLLAIALFLFLPGLGLAPVHRQQELRVLLTARDMAEHGRWLEPRFLGELRLRKPPLMYWLVGSLYQLGLPSRSAFVGRLPSALGGAAFLLCLYLGGRLLIGRRRAFAGALCAGLSLIVLRQAQLAETDVLQALFVAASTLSGLHALRRANDRAWMLAGLCAGLGFMIKGPASVCLPPLAWISFALLSRHRAQPPWRRPGLWTGLALCLLLAAPWYLYVERLSSSAAQSQVRAELAALLVESPHAASPFYYLYTAPMALLPWGLLLPSACWAAFRRARARRGLAALAAWFATTFIVLSLLRSKQIHYALLLVPPAALITGALLMTRGLVWQARVHLFTRSLAALLLGAAALVLLLYAGLRDAHRLAAVAALALGAAAAAAVALRARHSMLARLCRLALATALLLPAMLLASEQFSPRGAAVARLFHALPMPAPGKVICCGPMAAAGAFYAPGPATIAGAADDAWKEAAPGDFVLATWRRATRPPLPGAEPLLRQETREEGAALYRKPPRP